MDIETIGICGPNFVQVGFEKWPNVVICPFCLQQPTLRSWLPANSRYPGVDEASVFGLSA